LKTLLPKSLAVITLLLIPFLTFSQAPSLGASSSFALFTAAGAFTNNGASQVKGDIGTNGGAYTGFPPGIVIGAVHLADPITAQAASDLGTAYGTINGLTCGEVIGTTLGSGQILAPNIYCLGGASSLNGELILDGAGDPSSIFILKIGGALSTSTFAKVTLTNGASLCNVFWVINGAFTLGEGSSFVGTVLAGGAINLLEGASLTGRGLSVGGAISLNNNIINGSSPSLSTITSAGATTFCAGGSVVLSGNIGGTWSTGATTPTIKVTTSGDYFVANNAACGSAVSNHIVVVVNPLPSCTISGSDVICGGQSTELCAPVGAASYLWSTGASTRCITVTTAGTYSITVTSASGCENICSKILVDSPLPICAITGIATICTGQSTQLCASGGASYLWSTSATSSCIDVTAAGTYTVTVTNANGCSSTCSQVVTVNSLPICLITGNDAICQAGQSSELCASGGTSYLWSTGASASCITITATGTYSVTITNASGCISTCSKAITINPSPVCTIAGNDAICSGQSIQLCASGGSSYLWSTGASTSCITVNATGMYTVTATNTSGCVSICSKFVTVDPLPVCLITGNEAICVGTSTELCSSGGTSYLWSTGARTSCITVGDAGTYSVTVTNAAGCTSVCSKTIRVTQLTSCLITGQDAICVGQSTQLCVPAGATSYLWNTGATTNCITVKELNTYSVTVTNAGACMSICSKIVSRSQSSTCLITGEDLICLGQSTQLCVPTGAVGYLWSTGATANCITVDAVGTYSVTVTEEEGCTRVCSKTIKLSQETTCLITGYNTVCVGQSTQLCVPTGAISYAWSTGATTNCISVNAAGRYSVTVTYPGGCISTCSKTIKLSPAVSCVITGNSFICEGRIAQLCAPALADAYLWSNGAKTRCIQVRSPGTYSVTVTYVGGCVSTCSKTITLNEETTCEITGKTVLCPGQTTQLCAAVDGAIDYWWSTGEQTQCINVTAPGTYGLTLTTSGGCMSFCSKTVTRCPDPINYTGKTIVEKQVIQKDGNIQVRIYPNPLYAKTMIEFQNTGSDSHVLIDIYTSTGSKVATIFNGEVEKNVQYNTEWDAEGLAGGIYYCRIVNGLQINYKKLVLIKQ